MDGIKKKVSVFKFIATDKNDKHFERSIVNSGWHLSDPVDNRSLCGIQCDGDDGYAPSEIKKGEVTCELCKIIIKHVLKEYGSL
jgi:hypothetical protein